MVWWAKVNGNFQMFSEILKYSKIRAFFGIFSFYFRNVVRNYYIEWPIFIDRFAKVIESVFGRTLEMSKSSSL